MEYLISDDDKSFTHKVEQCEFPVFEFDHRAHLKLAYVYIVQSEEARQAIALMRNALLRLLEHAGIDAEEKYHETMTEAWIVLVKLFLDKTQGANSADDFIESNPELLNPKILLNYYSESVLFSDEARTKYVSPDLKPIS